MLVDFPDKNLIRKHGKDSSTTCLPLKYDTVFRNWYSLKSLNCCGHKIGLPPVLKMAASSSHFVEAPISFVLLWFCVQIYIHVHCKACLPCLIYMYTEITFHVWILINAWDSKTSFELLCLFSFFVVNIDAEQFSLTHY